MVTLTHYGQVGLRYTAGGLCLLWVCYGSAYHGYTHYGQVGLRYMAGGLCLLWVCYGCAYHGYTHYGQVGLRYMAGGLAALRISPPQLSTSASMLKKVATPSHLVITPPPSG